MDRITTLETLIEIEQLKNYAKRQIEWRKDDLQNLNLDGLPKIQEMYKNQIKSKEAALERIEQRFQRILHNLTINN